MNIMEKNQLTKEGKVELEKELKHLIDVERPKVIIEIKEAREQGDLSENAEYDAARDRQGQVEDRIKQLEEILANSEVIKTSGDKIRLGSEVEFKIISGDKKGTTGKYKIVGSLEADPKNGKISNKTPFAQAVMNLGVSDNEITIDANVKYDIVITSIKNN